MEYNFATKEDIQNLANQVVTQMATKNELKTLQSEFTELRLDFAKLRHEFLLVEHKMTIKFGLMQAASVGLLAALIKFF